MLFIRSLLLLGVSLLLISCTPKSVANFMIESEVNSQQEKQYSQLPPQRKLEVQQEYSMRTKAAEEAKVNHQNNDEIKESDPKVADAFGNDLPSDG